MCVFCRNEENEMKSKEFGEEMRKICSEEGVVTTIEQKDEEVTMQLTLDEVTTTVVTTKPVFSQHARWLQPRSRPQPFLQAMRRYTLGVVSTTTLPIANY